jgi:hypothetical protein
VRPDEVEVRFGIKVSGGADWFVAKTAREASFEIKLTWARLAESPAAVSEAANSADGTAEVEPNGSGELTADGSDVAREGETGGVSSSGAGGS